MAFNRKKFSDRFNRGLEKIKENCFRQSNGFVYHRTLIVQTTGDDVKLFSGGYHTATTKEHMNALLDCLGISSGVFQRAGDWYLWFRPKEGPQAVFEFHEGISALSPAATATEVTARWACTITGKPYVKGEIK